MKSEQGGHEPRLGLSGIDGIAELDFLEWVRDRLRLPAAAPLSLISIPEGGIGLDFPSWLIHRVVLCILPPFAPFGVTDRDWTPVWGGGITAADLDPAGAAGQTRFWIATRVAAFEDEDCFRVCVSWDVQIRVFINTPVIDMLVGVSEQLRDTLEEFNEGPLTDDEAANMGWSPPAHTRAGVYAHEQAHVQLARAALATSEVSGGIRRVLDECAEVCADTEEEARRLGEEKARELKAEVQSAIDSGGGHDNDPATLTPPEGGDLPPDPNRPMPEGVDDARRDADLQQLADAGYEKYP